MTRLPSKVHSGACSSSSTRSLKCVPLALSSVIWSVRNESGLVRVAVGMTYLGRYCTASDFSVETRLAASGGLDKLDDAKPEFLSTLRWGKPRLYGQFTLTCWLWGFGLCQRRNCSFDRAQVVGGCNQNLQSANARRDGDDIEQFDGFVDIHGKVTLGRERGDSAADIAGERLQFLHGDQLNFSFSRGGSRRV